MPAQSAFGSARKVMFGDNEVVIDLARHKETRIRDRFRIEFRTKSSMRSVTPISRTHPVASLLRQRSAGTAAP
jgi:hypothetical protein